MAKIAIIGTGLIGTSLALALKEAGLGEARAYGESFSYRDKRLFDRSWRLLPESAQQLILRFDLGGPVARALEPFTFELDEPK